MLNSLIEKKEGGRATLKVTIPADDFHAFYEDAIKNLAREVNIPGFRKGHVPKQIIVSRLGEDYILTEAASLAISKTYLEAMRSNDIQPFSEPEYDVQQVEAKKDFIYTIVVDVLPEIDLPEYKGIKAVKKLKTVTDADVEKVLTDLQKRQAQLVAVENRDTVEDGDYILFDFKGFVDDEPFEGGAAENYTLQVGSGSFIPGFEDQLIGKKIGEEGEVKVTFPENYHQQSLAGKESVFKVKVNEIKKEELPEVDDEFAKDVSDKETLLDLKNQIKEDLVKDAEHHALHHLEDEILEQLVKDANFDVPPKMVDLQVDHLLNDYKSRIEYQGISWESYLEHSNKDVDAIKEELRPQALTGVKNYFILKEIALKEDIQVFDEEVDQKLAEIADSYQMTKDMIRDYYEKNGRLDDLRYELQTQKTLRFLVDNASVEVQEVESHDH